MSTPHGYLHRALSALLFFLFFNAFPVHAQKIDVYDFQAFTSPYQTLSDATPIIPANIDDSLSLPIDIGFSFTFGRQTYTQFQVSSNGFLRLGSTSTHSGFGNDLAATELGPLLAPLWDDLRTGNEGSIRFALTGLAPQRILTVEFFMMHWDFQSDSANASFQVHLYETSDDIAFVYGRMGPTNNTSGGASIGLGNGLDGNSDFLSVTPASFPTASGRKANNEIASAQWLTEGTTYLFSKQRFANDLQAVSIDTVHVRMFDSFMPEATYRNLGWVPQTEVAVTFTILRGDHVFYESTRIINTLAPSQYVKVTFDEAQGLGPGLYTTLTRITLNSDENPQNNEIDGTLLVNWAVFSVMNRARARHTATPLPNGNLLVAGGSHRSASTEAEVYDPATRTWTPTSTMVIHRESHTATLLPNGKVLVTGGKDAQENASRRCELFDPETQSWTETGPMATPRFNHTATRLDDGRILIAGGYRSAQTSPPEPLSSTEFYDPASGAWKTGPSMIEPHALHTATALPDNTILIAGGVPYASSERYDPMENAWLPAAPLHDRRYGHTATILAEGAVLVLGGTDVSPARSTLATAEIYDPQQDAWSLTTPMANARNNHAATRLMDGMVMVSGGRTNPGPTGFNGSLSSAEIYDPAQASWTSAGHMARERDYHTASMLEDGTLLVAGGTENGRYWNSAELYDHAAVLATPVERHSPLPQTAHLGPNYPNPFPLKTTIPYTLSRPGRVTVTVYDILGRRVRTLVDSVHSSGLHTVLFDAERLPSGLYMYRMQIDAYTEVRKMLLIR